MRWLVSGLGVLAALAALGWFVVAWTTQRVVASWLDDRAAEGWLVNYSDLSVGGFPTGFETTLTDLDLADPDTGWVWSVPRLDLTQRAFRPDHVRADWPTTQSLASPEERLTILSDGLRSELDVQPAMRFALDAWQTTMENVEVTSSEGWTMRLPEGRLDGRRVTGETAIYDVTFSADGLVPPAPLVDRLDPAGVLPETIGTLRYEARMAFDRPWDIRAVEDRRPQITRVELGEMTASWGAMLFRAAGEVDVDGDGVPTGEIAVRAENWREMVELAVNGGALPAQLQGSVEGVLGMVAGLSGQPEDIDATLGFRNGRAFLGPLPLGQAPRLVLR